MAGGPDDVAVTATLIALVAAFRVASPEYWATMLLAPTCSCAASTVMLAEADDPVPASGATPICLPPEVNVMAPVGVAPLVLVTVAVTVTEPVDATEAAVACRATDADARAEESALQAVTDRKSTRLNSSHAN